MTEVSTPPPVLWFCDQWPNDVMAEHALVQSAAWKMPDGTDLEYLMYAADAEFVGRLRERVIGGVAGGLSYEKLREFAKRNPPPQEWYDEGKESAE